MPDELSSSGSLFIQNCALYQSCQIHAALCRHKDYILVSLCSWSSCSHYMWQAAQTAISESLLKIEMVSCDLLFDTNADIKCTESEMIRVEKRFHQSPFCRLCTRLALLYILCMAGLITSPFLRKCRVKWAASWPLSATSEHYMHLSIRGSSDNPCYRLSWSLHFNVIINVGSSRSCVL